MIFLLIFIFLFLIIILFFSHKKLSPIPYFPTNKKDLLLIISGFNLKNNQIVFDFGAGDGRVIFEAAKKAFQKKLNTQFFAIEINPFLILIMHIKRFFHSNKKNIKIICTDMFKIKLNSITGKSVNSLIFYLYISPWFIERIINNLKIKTLKKKIKEIRIISYFYPINFLKDKEKVINGKNKIYIYDLHHIK